MARTMTDEQERTSRESCGANQPYCKALRRAWAEVDATRSRVADLERKARAEFDIGTGYHRKWQAAEEALAAREAENAALAAEAEALRDALTQRGEHEYTCPLADFRAGRPREDGGYEFNYGGVWYETQPVDRLPKCECEMALLARQSGSREQLRAWTARAVEEGYIEGGNANGGVVWDDEARQECAAIVARLLPAPQARGEVQP